MDFFRKLSNELKRKKAEEELQPVYYLASSKYYDLFKFFADNHGLILLDSEIQEVIYEVEKFKQKENK